MKTIKTLSVAAACAMICLMCARPSSAAPASKMQEPPAVTVGAPQTKPAALATSSGVVNINEASSEQLQLLPGVGPSRAEAIVTYRKSHPFKRVEELTRIKGIGRKSLLRLRALLSVSGPTTLKERPPKASTQNPVAQQRQAGQPLRTS